MSYLPLVALVILLIIGVPIAFSLAGAGILGIFLVTGDLSAVVNIMGSTTFSTTAQFILTTIPTFVLMAYFSSFGGLAKDLYDCGADWLSEIPGGLGIATVFACAIFGAMSGASVAAASVMAKIAMPNMRRFGYSETLAAGTIAVGSTLDILIPPSIAMVIYGIMTGTSIGKLLIAGIVPGIVLAILLAIAIFVWATLRPGDAPRAQGTSWAKRWKSLGRTWPSLLLIVLVLGLLYTGIATPTEVGAIGAFLAAVIGVAMRRLSWSDALTALKETVSTSSMIFMVLIGGMIFGYYMTLSQIPQHIITAVTELNLNRWVIVVGIVVIYFLLSMFMDELPLVIITLQFAFPLVVALKFDPIWFGVIMVMNIAMGLVFPPVGMCVFVVSAAANVDAVTVYKGSCILVLALIATTVLLFFFPQLAVWLPSMMH